MAREQQQIVIHLNKDAAPPGSKASRQVPALLEKIATEGVWVHLLERDDKDEIEKSFFPAHVVDRIDYLRRKEITRAANVIPFPGSGDPIT